MVKLDWDIDAEQNKRREYSEDSVERRRRYAGVLKLLGMIAGFLVLVALVVFVVQRRWTQINERLETLLVNTVESEVAALRIGNLDDYLDIQRSATDDWLLAQEQTFQAYQDLKASSDVTLSGRVADVTIEDQRGRVNVEEIIDGIPYQQVWFYWRYDDGWHHVPPDYTFWGEPNTIEREQFTIEYREVDALTAEGVADRLPRWLERGCSLVDCTTLPPLTVEITSEPLPGVQWAGTSADEWRLQIPSPYRNRARADMPFDPPLQSSAATLLAEGLVDTLTNGNVAAYPHDAYYLRSATVTWLVGQFMQVQTDTSLITSLVQNYGEDTLAQLLRSLQPTSTIGLVTTVIDVPTLADANLNWTDFIEYRLRTEAELIRAGDQAAWERLYHFRDDSVRSTAMTRFTTANPPQSYDVQGIAQATYPDGSPQLQARVRVTDASGQATEQVIVFDLVNGNWLRAN